MSYVRSKTLSVLQGKILENKLSLEWVESATILIGLINSTLQVHSNRLLKLKWKLKWITLPTIITEKLSRTLNHLLVNNVNTKSAIFSPNLRHTTNNFDMGKFIRPLDRNTSGYR